MKHLLFVLVIIFGIGLFVWSRYREIEMGSFWDFVRNPSRMLDLDSMHKDLDEQASELSKDPDSIRELVSYFVFEAESCDSAWEEKQLLYRLRPTTYPFAMAILRDRANFEKLNRFNQKIGSVGEAPITRLLEVFDNYKQSPDDLIELLQPFLKSEHENIRTHSALTIGAIGNAQIIPSLVYAMNDKERRVAEYALMGFDYAISEDRVPIESKSKLFDTISGFWKGGGFPVSNRIPNALLYLDRERAVEFLTRDEIFSIGKGPVHEILGALKKYEIMIPRQQILGFVAQLKEKQKLNYPENRILAESIEILGEHRNRDDLLLIQGFLDRSDERVVEGAVSGLYRFHNFFDNIRDPWEIEEKKGWGALTKVERHLCAIGMLNAEVDNGGFSQYFFNSAGDHWDDALAGLKAAQSTEMLTIVEKVLLAFPNGKPSTDRDERGQQLSEIVTEREDPFSDQDSSWYKTTENLDRLLLFYNLENKEGRGKKAEVSK